MAVTYATSLKTTRMTSVRDAIDAGSGPGVLEICSAAYAAVLASIPFNDPCGSVSGAVLTFNVSPNPQDTSADNTGTAAIARIKDSNGNIIVSGLTVGTSGADIIVTSTSVTAGDTVKVTAASITHG